jgi:hypothetical protein
MVVCGILHKTTITSICVLHKICRDIFKSYTTKTNTLPLENNIEKCAKYANLYVLELYDLFNNIYGDIFLNL